MEKNDIEIHSPKARNVIGRMPSSLIVASIVVYTVALIVLLVITDMIDMEGIGTILRRVFKI